MRRERIEIRTYQRLRRQKRDDCDGSEISHVAWCMLAMSGYHKHSTNKPPASPPLYCHGPKYLSLMLVALAIVRIFLFNAAHEDIDA